MILYYTLYLLLLQVIITLNKGVNIYQRVYIELIEKEERREKIGYILLILLNISAYPYFYYLFELRVIETIEILLLITIFNIPTRNTIIVDNDMNIVDLRVDKMFNLKIFLGIIFIIIAYFILQIHQKI